MAQSKRDIISKFLAIFQTLWFIIQCIARGIEGLALTELEVYTLAFALVNIVSYCLWLKKPQSVRYPMKIRYRTKNDPLAREEVEQSLLSRVIEITGHWFILNWELLDPMDRRLRFIVYPFTTTVVTAVLVVKAGFYPILGALRRIRPSLHNCVRDGWKNLVLWFKSERKAHTSSTKIRCKPIRAICFPFFLITRHYMNAIYSVGTVCLIIGIVGLIIVVIFILIPLCVGYIPLIALLFIIALLGYQGALIVRSKAHYRTGRNTYALWLYAAFFAVFTLFGAIHCSLWNSVFPTHKEQVLWRVSAGIMTCLPLLILMGFLVMILRKIGRKKGEPIRPEQKHSKLERVRDIVPGVLFIYYTIPRMIILVLTFMQLRALPPSAYETVNWTELIPHI